MFISVAMVVEIVEFHNAYYWASVLPCHTDIGTKRIYYENVVI